MDLAKAHHEAEELFKAGEAKFWGTEESVFNKVHCSHLCFSSKPNQHVLSDLLHSKLPSAAV